PAEPVPTTTVLLVTTGTSVPSMRTVSAPGRSAGVVIEDLLCWLRGRPVRAVLRGALDEPGGVIPRGVLGSEPGDVHAAVDVDDLSGGVGHAPCCELHDGAGHVIRCAPPGHGGQSVGELLVVLLLDPGGHIGGDHARAH